MLGFHRKSNIVDTFYGSMAEQLIDSCHKMVLMSRCFIPVETVTAIYVVVPRKAEYETGFHLWVSRVAMLGANIEAKVIFVCHPSSREFIETVIAEDKVGGRPGLRTCLCLRRFHSAFRSDRGRRPSRGDRGPQGFHLGRLRAVGSSRLPAEAFRQQQPDGDIPRQF